MDQSQLIYCNINLNTTTGDTPAPLKRQYVRANPILNDRSKYHIAIVRACFPLSSVWLWNPELQLGLTPPVGQPPTQTVYHVGLLFNAPGGVTITQSYPLHLIVTNQYVPPPPSAPLLTQPDALWTAVYDYQTIADMYNNAFATCFTNLKTAVTAAGYIFPSAATAPFMQFNSSTGQYSISLNDYAAYGTNMTTGNIDIYFSSSLVSYLDGYQLMIHNNKKNQASTIAQYFDIMLKVPTILNPTPTTVVIVQQQWSASYVYHALQTIIIMCNGVGVVQENVDRPIYDQGESALATSWTSSVLADFAPDLSNIGAFRQPLVYNASSIVPGARFSKIVGGGTLYSFELSAYWVDANGRQWPLTTNSNQQAASIKVCFCPSSLL